MKKRFLAAFFAASLIFTMAGCGKKEADPMDGFSEEPVEVASDGTETSTGDTDGTYSENTEPTVGIGDVMMLPGTAAEFQALAGTNALTFYFLNASVEAGSGNIAVYAKSDGSHLSSVNIADPGTHDMGEIDETGKALTGWSSGVMCRVYLTQPFAAGESYFVGLHEGCFTANGVKSKAVLDNTTFTFTTKPYGLGQVNIPDAVKTTNTVNIPVVFGTGATQATVTDLQNISCEKPALTSDGKFTFTFPASGPATVTIRFYAASGKEVDSVPLYFTVQ